MTIIKKYLRAPFPYFGGKSTVAPVIWKALGQPKHYIEPFFGSGAALLLRPDYNPKIHMETICDKDGFVANAWRGMQFAPDELAHFCDWPVNHADLNARRKYLNDLPHNLNSNGDLLKKLCEDPDWFDARIAGYWVWCMSCWIGSGLIRPNAMPEIVNDRGINSRGIIEKRPNLGNSGQGVAQNLKGGRPQVALQGGINALGMIPPGDNPGSNQIPLLHHETGICRRPTYGFSGAHGVHRVSIVEGAAENKPLDVRDPYTPEIYTWFRVLSERLRRVRVVCGDWTRVCGGDWQDSRGTCGIFFDPTYDPEACNRDPKIYTVESDTSSRDVRDWCIERGERKSYRIVLAGYYDEHKILEKEYGWTVHRWSAHGGFANRGKGKTQGDINRHKETLFLSPHCYSSGLKRFGLETPEESGSVQV